MSKKFYPRGGGTAQRIHRPPPPIGKMGIFLEKEFVDPAPVSKIYKKNIFLFWIIKPISPPKKIIFNRAGLWCWLVLNDKFKSLNKSYSNNSYLMVEPCWGFVIVSQQLVYVGQAAMLCNLDINQCQTYRFKLKYIEGSAWYDCWLYYTNIDVKSLKSEHESWN